MRVFVDTNVLIDVLARRQPHVIHSACIWSMAETSQIAGLISAVSVTNIFYVVRRLADLEVARRALTALRDTFDIVTCDARVMHQAMDADMKDFEDAVQFFSALHARAACLVTRNPAHFTISGVAIATPEEFLSTWE